MTPLMRRSVAEIIGTFFLCFVGVAAICTNTKVGAQGSGLLGVALAHGLALSIAISALGKISGGHFNPAVTIGIASVKMMPPFEAAVYVASQLVGGLLGAIAARAGFSTEVFNAAGGGVPVPAQDVSAGVAIFLEAIGAFFLITAVFGTAVDPRAPKIGGFGIGLTVAFDILAIGPLTGASMNPARNFGPAIVAGVWNEHYVYWIGPIIGGVVAAWVYKIWFWEAIPAEEPAKA